MKVCEIGEAVGISNKACLYNIWSIADRKIAGALDAASAHSG